MGESSKSHHQHGLAASEMGSEGMQSLGDVALHHLHGDTLSLGYLAVLLAVEAAELEDFARAVGQLRHDGVNLAVELIKEQTVLRMPFKIERIELLGLTAELWRLVGAVVVHATQLIEATVAHHRKEESLRRLHSDKRLPLLPDAEEAGLDDVGHGLAVVDKAHGKVAQTRRVSLEEIFERLVIAFPYSRQQFFVVRVTQQHKLDSTLQTYKKISNKTHCIRKKFP